MVSVIFRICVAEPPEQHPDTFSKKKVDPKVLIQQKLAELKRRAREESVKNADERNKSDKLSITVKPKTAESM